MIGDSLDPKDDIQTRLSQPPAASEMPAELLCPSGHRAHRRLITVQYNDPHDQEREIPCWVCPQCVVTFRYQECTLPPGEEGHP